MVKIKLLNDKEGNQFFIDESIIQRCIEESDLDEIEGFVITEIKAFKLTKNEKTN